MCKMHYDPSYPTTYPWGMFYLYQAGPSDDVHIWGFMHQMPAPSSEHGFAINENRYDWRTKVCRSAGLHFNPTGETSGEMNNMTYPSHVGNLKPFEDDPTGSGFYFASAQRPTMYGPAS
jgi:Cu/Zn superoxide dismutase